MKGRRLSRDEIVQIGLDAKVASESSDFQKGPWIYKYKAKSGNNSTVNVETQCCNLKHLKAEAIIENAVPNETLNVYSIVRVMKAHVRSVREDI